MPNDLLIYQLIQLPIESLIKCCQSNSRIAKLCNNDYMWQQRVINQFEPRLDEKCPNVTWKDFYFEMLTSRIVSVTMLTLTYNIKINFRSPLKDITNYIIKTINLYSYGLVLIISDKNRTPLAVTTFNQKLKYLEHIFDKQWPLKTDKIVVTNISPPPVTSLEEDIRFDLISLGYYL